MIAFILSSFSFTVLTALVPYFIQYQLDMGDQVSFVLLVMLLMIGIFLIPAKMVSDRINKGPAYALGLFIASLAIMTSFFFPHGPTPLIYVVAAVAGLGFSSPVGLPVEHAAGRGRVRREDDRRTARRHLLRPVGFPGQVHRRAGRGGQRMGAGVVRLRARTWSRPRGPCSASACSLPSCRPSSS